MATNLRLRPEAEAALKKQSEATGRSQQDLMREAIEQYLGLAFRAAVEPGSIEDLLARGILKPATPYQPPPLEPMKLPPGVTSLDLLDREDRF